MPKGPALRAPDPGAENTRPLVHVQGQKSEEIKQTPQDVADTHFWMAAVDEGVELSRGTRRDGSRTYLAGTRDGVPPPAGGPRLKDVTHTHQDTDGAFSPAIFSFQDLVAAIHPSSDLLSHTTFGVIGYKWPFANQVLSRNGCELEPTLMRTTVTVGEMKNLSGVEESSTWKSLPAGFPLFDKLPPLK
jgi:hypothetical protein